MTLRLVCVSTFTALGLAWSPTPFARTLALLPAAVTYAPPPRAVYRNVPVNPVYVAAPPPAPIRLALRIVATAPRAATDQLTIAKKAVESA